MYKAIIFDADGMIIHGERFSKRLEEEFGITRETTSPFMDSGKFQLCLTGKADLKDELANVIKDWGWKGTVDDLLEYWFSEKHNVIDERFLPIIRDLRDKGIRCFLASNNEKYRTNNLINERGLGAWFDKFFSSAFIGFKKPEREFFEAIFKELPSLKKDAVLFWDDDPKMLKAPKNSACPRNFTPILNLFEPKYQNLA